MEDNILYIIQRNITNTDTLTRLCLPGRGPDSVKGPPEEFFGIIIEATKEASAEFALINNLHMNACNFMIDDFQPEEP